MLSKRGELQTSSSLFEEISTSLKDSCQGRKSQKTQGQRVALFHAYHFFGRL